MTTVLSPIGLPTRPYPQPFDGKEALSQIEARWQNAQVLKRLESGNELTTARLPPGTWKLLVKAQDTSENYSEEAAEIEFTVGNTNRLVYEEEQAPRWPGTVSNFVRHAVSGRLLMDSTKQANELTNEELFEQYVPYPVAQADYFAPEFDAGFDALEFRVWADLIGGIRSDRSGIANPELYIDYRANAESYDGYESWTIGTISARYVKYRATMLSADGVGYLEGFKPVVDAGDREERYVEQTIAPGGTTLNYETQFFSSPLIEITPKDGALIPWWENKTTTSVTIHLENAAGADVGGVADITVKEP